LLKWKTTNKNDNKVRFLAKDSSAYIYSVLIHIVIFFTLSSFNPIVKNSPEKKTVKIISAKLFYNKITVKTISNQKEKESGKSTEQSTEQSSLEDHLINTSNSASTSKTEKVIKPVESSKITKKRNSEALTKKTSVKKVPTKLFNSLNSLQSLRKNIDSKSYKKNGDEAYQAFVKNKNFIPQSTTKYNQIPEAKAVDIKVNCNNAFNKSMTVISGLLGGTIKCNSFNGSQKHIDARLEKLGVIKDKKRKTN
jgi:DNA mismatch repair ATPase MutL